MADASKEGGDGLCLACHKEQIEYEAMPCRHPTLCKHCAMKQATGGRCKICKEVFTELRRKREHGADDDDDEEEEEGQEEEGQEEA